MRYWRKDSGIALITTLISSLIVVALLILVSTMVVSGSRNNRDVRSRNELVQMADGVSDQARIEVVASYSNTLKNPANFLLELAGKTREVHVVDLGSGITAKWKVANVSGPTDRYGWADIHASVRRGDDVQTVVRRVSFGANPVFNLAMLSEDTNCVYCHLRVRGDVGSLNFLRPGYGVEGGDGWGSGAFGGGSVIRGDLYVAAKKGDVTATNVSNDASDLDDLEKSNVDKAINGAKFKGVVNLRANSRNGYLPEDTNGDGIPDFPAIDPEVAKANATGTISGGADMQGFPAGKKYGDSGAQITTINGVYEGNLVLVGTPSNPIVLNGDIYATGDVVIKGVVSGRGAIYSGRNTYLAGNVTSKSPPDAPGTGICSTLGISDRDGQNVREQKSNECAKLNVGAGRDELRLGTRGTTVIGDYTERDNKNELLPFDKRQSADYYRAQFGFSNEDKYYDKLSSDELTKDGEGKYRNVQNQEIAASNVVTKSSNVNAGDLSGDAYSYSFRPGKINRETQNFDSWMSDSQYKDLLGSENMTYNTWRTELPERRNGESDSNYIGRLTKLLKEARVDSDLASKIASQKAGNGGYEVFKKSGWGLVNYDRGTIRVMTDGNQSYETQVTKIDAFIYSNSRVAGKTSMRPLALNGGLISKQIGVLAPGRRKDWWMDDSRYDFLNNAGSACGSSSGYAVADTEDCAFTVNYDYRLRNGGYGYNIVSGNLGQTLAWRISDVAADQVNP